MYSGPVFLTHSVVCNCNKQYNQRDITAYYYYFFYYFFYFYTLGCMVPKG